MSDSFKLDFLVFLHGLSATPWTDCSILGTYRPGEFIFQCPIFLPFHTVHGVLKARILKWFAIPFSSGPHCVRPLHHDPSILGGPTLHSLVSLSETRLWMEPKQKHHPVVDVTGDRSKVRCCKEQYCIETWNVRSMNQGKLEVVKQEMARVKVDILGISELRWTVMGEFNSDDHYIYYCGQEFLRKNGIAIIVNKRV